MFEFVTVAQDEREQVTNGVQGEVNKTKKRSPTSKRREQVTNGVQGEVTARTRRRESRSRGVSR